MTTPTTRRLSELTDDQRGHLAWRLDRYTVCGLLTAQEVAWGQRGDFDLVDALMTYGSTPREIAEYHARRVLAFVMSEADRAALAAKDKALTVAENLLEQGDREAFDAIMAVSNLQAPPTNAANAGEAFDLVIAPRVAAAEAALLRDVRYQLVGADFVAFVEALMGRLEVFKANPPDAGGWDVWDKVKEELR
jgi:hypothetical protein